jgi:hypothetical protein
MAFGTGGVTDNKATLYSALPDVQGPESPWNVTQWSQEAYLNPSDMTTDNAALADPLYGTPLYSWQSSDGTSLSVFSQAGSTVGGAPYVFNLEEQSGGVDGAGANLFLGTQVESAAPVLFDNPITYSLDAKITSASLNPDSGGFVLAQAFTGFTVTFNATDNPNYDAALPTYSAFMQLGITNSSGPQSRYLSQQGNSFTYQYDLPANALLPFAVSTGGPTAMSFNLNEYLDDMINAIGTSMPAQDQDLDLWSLNSMYVGLETDLTSGNAADPSTLSDGLQVSNISLSTDTSQTVAYQDPSTFEQVGSSAMVIAPTLFTQVDTSQSNATTAITADSYDGPLSFLAHGDAFSYNGADNVQLSAVNAVNPLIASGSGDDLLTGSATGSSILDAGTGANIENDGGNGNTTFVQNGYVAGNTWDFLQNVHGSDEDIMFGYIAGFSKISVQANGGLASDTGATVTIDPGNGNTEKVTFVGVSAANLHGCSANIDGVPSWVLWTS